MATDATHRIKNLAVALRAVSRSHQKYIADRIYVLLQKELTAIEKEAQRPALVADSTYETDPFKP